MSDIRNIAEQDFVEDLKKGLDEIATSIQKSGLTIAEIARGTRCHWETVYHASRRIPVRYDSYRRIMYYLNTK